MWLILVRAEQVWYPHHSTLRFWLLHSSSHCTAACRRIGSNFRHVAVLPRVHFEARLEVCSQFFLLLSPFAPSKQTQTTMKKPFRYGIFAKLVIGTFLSFFLLFRIEGVSGSSHCQQIITSAAHASNTPCRHESTVSSSNGHSRCRTRRLGSFH